MQPFSEDIAFGTHTLRVLFHPVSNDITDELHFIVTIPGYPAFSMAIDEDGDFRPEGPAPYLAAEYQPQLSAAIEHHYL